MDYKRMDGSSDHSVTSLGGLYTDFDGWVARFNSCYKRSPYFSKEISTRRAQNYNSRQNGAAILENDVFLADLLIRQRHFQRPAKTPSLIFYKDNEEFAFYDHVFYRFIKKNGDRRLVYQYIRSKL